MSTAAAIRERSIPAAVLDELAWWPLEGQANSDAEVQASVQRRMLGFPDPRLVKISTAAERRQHASQQAADAAAKAWWEELNPPVFRDLRTLPEYRTVHRWLMKFRPDDPDRRRFETALRQYVAARAELSVRYWAVGRRRDAVLRAIRQREIDEAGEGGTP